MPSVRDTLLPEERAEFDAILQELDPIKHKLVRIIEIFMTHQLGAAAMLNEEVRDLLAHMGADLVDHELRLCALEQRLRRLERQ